MFSFVVNEFARVASKSGATLMLTSGRSAAELYRNLRLSTLHNARFFMGDERCVPGHSAHSNAWLVQMSLFNGESVGNWFPIKGDSVCHVEEAARYGALLPEEIDLLLLSVGEDGHIASLFPDSAALESRQKVVFVADAPKLPAQRITITPKVICAAREVVVMAAGQAKGEVLARALHAPDDYCELPVRLTIGRTWVLDAAAYAAFNQLTRGVYYDTRIMNA